MGTERHNSNMSGTRESLDNSIGPGVGRFLWKALSSRSNPLLAQMVVTRRCNLSCGYCNEYDDFSPPVAAGRTQCSTKAEIRSSGAL